MKISILVSTYGDDSWNQMALNRAMPSCIGQGAHEVLYHHEADGTVASCRNNNAAKATGDTAKTRQAYEKLVALASADSDRLELSEAKAFLAN